jgi:hypothetical protein
MVVKATLEPFSVNPSAEASSTIVSCLIGLTDDAAQPTGSRLHLVPGPNAIRPFVHAIDGTHAFFRMPRSRRSGWSSNARLRSMKLVNTTSKSVMGLPEIIVTLASSKKQAAISFVCGYLTIFKLAFEV